jgi:hypothetical protein
VSDLTQSTNQLNQLNPKAYWCKSRDWLSFKPFFLA